MSASVVAAVVVLAAVAVGITAAIGVGVLALAVVPAAFLLSAWILLLASRLKTGDAARSS